MCSVQQHKHWEQTGVMNRGEEPTAEQSKLGSEGTVPLSSGGDYALNRVQNTTPWKPMHPL